MVSEIKADKLTNQSGDQDTSVDLSTNDVVAVKIAGSEKFRVHSDGNVAIAKTSLSTWTSGYNALQIAGRGFVAGEASSDLYLGQGAYHNSGWKYEASSEAVSMTQHSAGKITHFVAASGTAGNAISWITAMDIEPSGRTTNAATIGGHHTKIVNTHGSTPDCLWLNFSAAAPDNNSQYFLYASDSSSQKMTIWSDGDVVNHDNSYGSTSDQKLKQQITDASSQWADIKAIKVRKYKMNEDVEIHGDSDNHWRLGVVAQELEASGMSGLVKERADRDAEGEILKTTTKSVKYSILYMKAIKALQEAMARIETLETKVAALEAK